MALKSTFIVAVKLNYELYLIEYQKNALIWTHALHKHNNFQVVFTQKKREEKCINNWKAAKRYVLLVG